MTTGNQSNTQAPKTPEFILRLSAPLAWAGMILWLSLTPSPPQISGVLGWDKLQHAGAYGLLALLVAQFLLCLPLERREVCRVAFLAAICFGALLEILQILVQTGRTAEWLDLFADALGAALACVLFRQIHGLICRKQESAEKNLG